MFYDEAKIHVRSGDGGDGMISFRREKFVRQGGPDGGDGGRGGDIIFIASSHLNSLATFQRNRHYRAGNGTHGTVQRMTGANGEDLRLQAPLGTIIRNADTGEILADLTEPGQEVVILAGGRGGRGNQHFATSRHQAPRIAERGEPGEELWLALELKLIADVGLVGVPNAGKSTLLSVISAARPKIGDYPFTTLQPSLGVVTVDEYDTIVVADIPGLIEGASVGVGLGHDFLRHIERTRTIIHLLDGNGEDPLADWVMINSELALYNPTLATKPQVVVLNKIDLPHAREREPQIRKTIQAAGFPFMTISAVTGDGVKALLYEVKRMVDAQPQTLPTAADEPIIIRPPAAEKPFTIKREGSNTWRVKGKEIERIASMTYFEFDDSLLRFQTALEKTGITAALTEAGVKVGDTVFIGDQELEWAE
ncbi:MAG: GTPase ObgE [Anaerolineae bacterium]|nr:GTPase ObgE [Anaerolineae bacterium]RIK24481.1 MAG: GTPase ObgE [Anaerolineae bacterium]